MINNMLRITGLASGIDTESIISDLMKVGNMRVDSVKQKKQYAEWQTDAYREVSNLLRGFKDEYFDYLNPETNFRSEKTFAAYEAVSSNENILSVSSVGNITSVTHDVIVSSKATIASKESTTQASSAYSGLTGATVQIDAEDRMKKGNEFNITLDGMTKTITLDQDYTATTLEAGLNNLLEDAFGKNKDGVQNVSVTLNGADPDYSLTFNTAYPSSSLSISNSSNYYLRSLGFSDGRTNYITSGSITDFTGGQFKVKIDDGDEIDINVDGTGNTSIADLISDINTSWTGDAVGKIKAMADAENPDKIKFIATDVSIDKITITSGEDNNMLSKIGIGSGSVLRPLSSTVDFSSDDRYMGFVVKVDGVEHKIVLDQDYTSADFALFQTDLQAKLDAEGLNGIISTSIDASGNIKFDVTGDHIVQLKREDIIDNFGFTTNTNTNRIDLNVSLETVVNNSLLGSGLQPYDGSGDIEITVNDVTITATKEDSIDDILDKINDSDAGVTMSYDSVNDKFKLESDDLGSAAKIKITDEKGQFFQSLGLDVYDGIDTTKISRGTDAVISIDGTEISRASNSFVIDNISYDIKDVDPLTTITINTSFGPDDLIEKIEGFVEKYNELIGTINDKLSEEKFRDYKPLTDEQKDSMSDSQIEKWEEKAKSGILKNDSVLDKITNSMRRALNNAVDGVGIRLSDIGIKTSSLYTEKGKLVLDKNKLRDALGDSPNKVVDLFTKVSQYSYEDGDNRSNRYNEEGLANRLYDILQDNIRTTRDSNGRKGFLIEKAGIEGDYSEYSNMLYDQIADYNGRIDSLIDDLISKENYYYDMFARMESAISEMNNQSTWLTSQLNGGS